MIRKSGSRDNVAPTLSSRRSCPDRRYHPGLSSGQKQRELVWLTMPGKSRPVTLAVTGLLFNYLMDANSVSHYCLNIDKDFVVKKLIEHDEFLGQLATKTELTEFKDEVLTGLDQIMVMLRKLEEERLCTINRFDRHDKEITRIKKVVDLS